MAKTVKKAAAPPNRVNEPSVEVFDCEQRSDDWYDLHIGVPTASRFATILAGGRDGGESLTRRSLAYTLAGERITGSISETFESPAMRRGKDMEDGAREVYARKRFDVLAQVGFVRRIIPKAWGQDPLIVGCSPDALVGDDGGLEIKTMRPDLLIEMKEKGAAGCPAQWRAQVQGSMWVTGRAWWDVFVYYQGRAGYRSLWLEYRVERDEAYIKRLAEEVEAFEWEVRQIVKRMAP